MTPLSNVRTRHPLAWLAPCLLALLGCTRASNKEPASGLETATIRYEGTPGIVSIAELAEDLGLLAPLRLDFKGNNMTGGPHSIQAVVTGDLDVGGSARRWRSIRWAHMRSSHCATTWRAAA